MGFDNRWVVVYFGISPELENFVSIIMWPGTSQTSRKCFKQISDLIEEDEHNALKFEGAYRLRPPNGIRPQNVEKLDIEHDSHPYYNWQYFPFIKDIGDTLIKPISAVNYRKVLLRNSKNDLVEDYVTIRVTVGLVVEMKGNELRVKVPFINLRPHTQIFKIRHNLKNEEITLNDIYYFLLIERAGKRPSEIFAIEKIHLADVIAHLVSFYLYKRFVNSSKGDEYRTYINRKLNPALDVILETQNSGKKEDLFYICTLDELDTIFKYYKNLIFKRVYPNIHEKYSFDLWDYISKFYLVPYYDINSSEGKVYYKPPIFRQELQDISCNKIQNISKIIHQYSYEDVNTHERS